MPSTTEITAQQLSRLIGLPSAPAIIDVRTEEDYAAAPHLLPGSRRRDFRAVKTWAGHYHARSVSVACQRGLKLSQGDAQTLEGGFEAWSRGGHLLVRTEKLPARDEHDRSVWVTRARPKVDRIACPWLIRRFIDPGAVFLFVAPSEVLPVAERFSATPFDIDGVFWSHRGETCTFDTMIAEFGLKSEPLSRLAAIVRGADTAKPDLAPEAAGLLAASLGYSRMYRDDLAQLDAALALYDAFYRWCRDATEETHNWPSAKVSA
jgi:rhodanese-related sulfurtransferase